MPEISEFTIAASICGAVRDEASSGVLIIPSESKMEIMVAVSMVNLF
jgi:hypothetical protein